MTRVATAAPHDALKYAKPERERRFLVAPRALPAFASMFARIDDLYLAGTRVRLRAMIGDGGRGTHYKLTQKLESPDPRLRQITTFYLSRAEYDAFAALPGHRLAKRRHRATSEGVEWGVDVFEGALAGLVLAEREFESDEALRAATPPEFAACEVTDDDTFSGGALAAADPARVLAHAATLLASAAR